MNVSLQELHNIDCRITELTTVFVPTLQSIVDYSKYGRTKNIIFYCIEGSRQYYSEAFKPLFTLEANDVLFIADETRYLTKELGSTPTQGICICFYLEDQNGRKIEINEKFSILAKDSSHSYYNKIIRLHSSILKNSTLNFEIKSALYSLLNSLLSSNQNYEDFQELAPAIKQIESHPEVNLSIRELADMCYMSERSFFLKFLKYSNGVSPLKYRNRIRIMKAEEMVNDSNTSLEEIAYQLGFYDSSHLCRYYKKIKGRTLKSRNKPSKK